MSTQRSAKGNNYSHFLANLDPFSIALIHSAARMDRVRYLQSETDKIHVTFSAKLLNYDESHFDVRTVLNVRIQAALEDEKPLARFNAVYDLHFHGEALTKQNIDRFVGSDVRIMVWPYMRELISSLSARMHVPPIVLPVGKSPKQ